ncbi:MAG: adenylate/guanylate cyclase domain-containing protein [Rhodospirillales bacterium]|nr:adenylate/guanylate cyclase domain-containing protein [Rhodospirillales bacterium]MDH3919243.1 adenylate/guanylate cyclase domain-containing protein [Rhodospirillales bacterium]MDH3969771.1 adenylate/guanylate cyclase domain-containing protein [Rhodospirillales bacterium]
MRAYRSAALTGIVVGTITSAIALTPVGLAIEDGLGLRWLFQLRGPTETPTDVVIVNTNDLSSSQLESHHAALPQNCLERLRQSRKDRRPRCLYTHLVDSLVRRGALVIVFDIFFGEPGLVEEDEELAAAIGRAGRVVLLQRLELETMGSSDFVGESLSSPIPALSDAAIGLGPFPLPKVPARVSQFWAFKASAGDVATLPAVALQVRAAAWLGHFIRRVSRAEDDGLGNSLQYPAELGGAQEIDRIMRRLRRELRADPAISDRLYRELESEDAPETSDDEKVLLTALARLYSGEDSYFLNYYGPPGTIRTIPGYAILGETASAGPGREFDVAGKVVFIGPVELSAAVQRDGFYTVFSRADGVDLSGVEIAASAFANLLSDQTLRRPNSLSIVVILIMGCILVGVGAYRRSGIKFAAATSGVTFLYTGAAVLLFVERDFWIPVILPPISQFVTVGFCLALRAGILRWPSRSVYGVCLLTDIEKFTETTEKFKPRSTRLFERLSLRLGVRNTPLMKALKKYFKRLSSVVEAHEGEVLHQIGDSMICIWRTREPQHGAERGRDVERSQDVREQVCAAALEIHQNVETFNKTITIFDKKGERLTFPTRIGIDIGGFEIGHFGGTFRSEFDVVGDPANTASRVEQLNKHLGTNILASQSVVRGLDRRFVVRRVGTFILSGKREKTRVCEIVRREDPPRQSRDKFFLLFEDALLSYVKAAWRSKRLPTAVKKLAWLKVAEEFKALQAAYPGDGPTEFFKDRAQRYSEVPPDCAVWPIRTVSEESDHSKGR